MSKKNLQNVYFVIGITISLLVTGVLWALGLNNVNTVTLGIIIISLGILLDIFSKLGEQQKDIFLILKFDMDLKDDNWLGSIIREVINDYFLAKSWSSTFINRRVTSCLEEIRNNMKNLAHGSFPVPPLEEPKIESEMLAATHHTFLAAAFVADLTVARWWNTEVASKYLDAHKNALKLDVRIERIVMVADAEQLLSLKGFVNRQLDMGIIVWVAWSKALPPILLEDFIVADNLSSIVSHTVDGRVRDVYYSMDPVRVKSYIEKFNQIQLHSKKADQIDWSKNLQELQNELAIWSGFEILTSEVL